MLFAIAIVAALIVWVVLALGFAVVIGRGVRIADSRETIERAQAVDLELAG